VAYYASKEQMIKAFGEVELIERTDREHTAAIIDDVLNRALDDAASEVASYIGKRYGNLLLVNTPPRLIGICCDIARYRLYDDGVTDTVRNRYLDAIAFLRDVRDGKNALGDEEADAGAISRTQVNTAVRRFTRASLRDY
jgi:phage gp36-like protein